MVSLRYEAVYRGRRSPSTLRLIVLSEITMSEGFVLVADRAYRVSYRSLCPPSLLSPSHLCKSLPNFLARQIVDTGARSRDR